MNKHEEHTHKGTISMQYLSIPFTTVKSLLQAATLLEAAPRL